MNVHASISSLPPARYNVALDHPLVRTSIRHFARRQTAFQSASFIEHIAHLPTFPEITVRDLLAAAKAAGLKVVGAHADASEIAELPTPFLTFLKKNADPMSPVDLVQIESIKRRRAVITHDRFGEEAIPLEHLVTRWSGVIVMLPDQAEPLAASKEIEDYRRQVALLPDFLDPDECRDLIAYCEAACFKRSRVMQRGNEKTSDVVLARFRSSASVVLTDRTHPVLSRLYRRCAEMEQVAESDIESIQCVRYKKNQRFRSHFDGGVDLPRLTTFLLYLNDGFSGGETYFPMIDQVVSPQAGACLRFPSCDRAGRVLWPSEHGGLPVVRGVKYALNIWVRCPPGQAFPFQSGGIAPALENSEAKTAIIRPAPSDVHQ